MEAVMNRPTSADATKAASFLDDLALSHPPGSDVAASIRSAAEVARSYAAAATVVREVDSWLDTPGVSIPYELSVAMDRWTGRRRRIPFSGIG